MFSITPKYIFTPKGFVTDHTIIFDTKILDFGKSEEMLCAYPDAESIAIPKESVLTPGFINAHVHLEFSANKTDLKYGRFIPWLYSVIQKREELVASCDEACIKETIETMLQSGTTTFGAISSFGAEMQACAQTPAKVLFFNELIGSSAAMADALWGDFLGRLNESKTLTNDTFIPGIAIHSPYSVHPVLVKKAVQLARDESLTTTSHLLESDAERQWLEESTGDFAPFFKDFLNQDQAVTSIEEFIESFDNKPTLFTHATKLSAAHAKNLQGKGHTIIHCPISNRLLGNGVLNLKGLYEYQLPYVCATDGLSSNYSLDLLEELKAALFMHDDADLDTLSISLLHSITTTAGEALGLKTGRIQAGWDADMLVFELDKEIAHEEDLALHLILKQFPLHHIFINGTDHKKG